MSRSTRKTSGPKLVRAIALLTLMLPFVAMSMTARAGSGTFQVGDVFVGVANGQTQWYRPDGTLVKTLDNGVGGFTTGMAFDSAGHLYGTNFSSGENTGTPVHPKPQGASGSVSEYDTDGTLIGPFGDGYATPEDLLFNKSGDAYVGNLGGYILKLDGNGNTLQTYNDGRTDWLDLAADQCTVFFTDESGVIHRYDVCSDSSLPNFADAGGQYALRLLPSGGLVAASSGTVNRFDSSGNIIQTYDAPGEDCWFALNLDPDGTSLWSADFCTADFVKFDIASGDVLETFNTGTGPDTVFGLTVFGEITVGGGAVADLSIDKSDSSDTVLVGDQLTYTITVTNNGPEAAKNVTVTDELPPSMKFQGSSNNCTGTKVVVCDFGTMANGETDSATIDVVPQSVGTFTNTATVSSSAADPNPDDNSDSATTVVNPVPSGGVQTGAGGTAGSPLLPGLLALGIVVVAGALRTLRTRKI